MTLQAYAGVVREQVGGRCHEIASEQRMKELT